MFIRIPEVEKLRSSNIGCGAHDLRWTCPRTHGIGGDSGGFSMLGGLAIGAAFRALNARMPATRKRMDPTRTVYQAHPAAQVIVKVDPKSAMESVPQNPETSAPDDPVSAFTALGRADMTDNTLARDRTNAMMPKTAAPRRMVGDRSAIAARATRATPITIARPERAAPARKTFRVFGSSM